MPHPIERLLDVGVPDGPSLDEALRLFAELRFTPDEGLAIRRLLARNARASLPEPLLVSVATALVDRGEENAAAAALALSSSLPALVLRADLLERAGDVAGALALVERVLSSRIDWPGARERHARWSAVWRGALVGAQRTAEPGTLPTSAETWPGAPFRLLRETARGGSGVVYEAEDRELGRRLALKVYHRPARDRSQLLHEAQVAVALAGEGIVRVFDADPEHGWLALEWVSLGALRGSLQRREPWVKDDVWGWAMPLARSLARVHAAGWVHNDVKPANVLFQTPGMPLLSDFGTARRCGAPSPPGSLSYVSPERLAGRPTDPSDDVYGFGRVLEDALGLRQLPDGSGSTAFLELADACTGPSHLRPRDGADLILLLDRMLPSDGRR